MNLKDAKILLVGDYPTPVYSGTLGSFKRAFDALNYTTLEFYFNINSKYLRFAKYLNSALKLLVLNDQKRLLNFIKQNNITHVVIFKGSYLLPNTIEEIKSNGIVIANFNPDNPFNTVRSSSNFIIREGIKNYNYYFSWSKKICKTINQSNKTDKAIYLPFAVDKSLIDFQPDFNSPDYTYQLAFGANADKERINQIQDLLKTDASLREHLFVFGSGWNNLKNVRSKEIKGKDYFKTIAQSKINLNFLRSQNKGAHNLRTFEIPACGGFMLHEYSEEAMEFFKADIHAVYFKTTEECIDKIYYYLQHNDERIKIAQAGYVQAMKFENSYEARVEEILSYIHAK